jgi:ABC-2 type transport system permease protein
MTRPDRFERLRGIVAKEVRQIIRNPEMLRIIFVGPIIQLVVFGYAVSTDLRGAKTMVVDHDKTQASRDLVSAVTSSGYFRIAAVSERSSDLVRALDEGRVIMGLEIPAGFARDMEKGDAQIQALFDGTNSNTAQVALSYVERIVLEHARRSLPVTREPPIVLQERAWYNPDLASRNYNVPATIGQLILLNCLLLTALAVVREKEIGTLEQLRVSPLTAGELILGKTLPFAAIALINLVLVTSVALLWFSIPLRGSIPLLLAASALYILSGLGLGLLISTFSNTQQEAFLSTFMVVMPAILLSGFLFPVSSMPDPVQWITIVNPVRHYIDVVRGIFLKGSGIDILWPRLLALALIGGAALSLASLRFRRTALQ